MNPLQQIPPAVRKWLYLAYAIVGLVLGGFQVAGQDTIADVSVIKCLAVLAYVGTALGFTAASNAGDSRTVAVTAPENAPTTVRADVEFNADGSGSVGPGYFRGRNERGAVDPLYALVVVLVAVLLLVVLSRLF